MTEFAEAQSIVNAVDSIGAFREASAALAAALCLRPGFGEAWFNLGRMLSDGRLGEGGRAYRPRIAHPTLAAAFVE